VSSVFPKKRRFIAALSNPSVFSMKNFSVPPTIEIKIEKVVYGGNGLGRHDGKVVFVSFAAPGDVLLVGPVETKKNYTRAEIVQILQPGPDRTQPPCPHFGRCGGCQWQHLSYRRQVEIKQQILAETIHHRFPETREIPVAMKASPQEYGYRSRARFQIRGAKIGFFRLQSHEVEEIESCPLLRPTLNSALAEIRKTRPAAPEIELACVEDLHQWAAAESELNPEKFGDRLNFTALPRLERKIGEFSYAVSPAAFFQVNDFLLADLVTDVMNLVQGNGSALDLFCGAGLFTLPLARRFEQVEGIDNSAPACVLARQNLAAADLHNVRISCSTVAEWVHTAGSSLKHFDLVLLDPPRTGAGQEVMNQIARWTPETILYISCDPQTLVRDLSALPQQEYKIDFVQGFDLFPQTYHFETVVRLKRVHGLTG
jgi:23S rRNA (uracil1939-C5)-methyltransferase